MTTKTPTPARLADALEELEATPCPAHAYFADGWDASDPWGSLMGAAFAVCEYLTLTGQDDAVPAGLEYRPAAGLTANPEAVAWIDAHAAELWEMFDEDMHPDTPDNPEMLQAWPGLRQSTPAQLAAYLERVDAALDAARAAGLDY